MLDFKMLKNIRLRFGVKIDDSINYPDYKIIENETGINYLIENNIFKENIIIVKSTNGYCCKRVFTNISGKALRLNELELEISNINFGKNLKDDFYYSLELPRLYNKFTFSVDQNRDVSNINELEFDDKGNNKWIDSKSFNKRINRSGYQPFPAFLLSNYKTNVGFVHGTLSQDNFFHNYLPFHDDNKLVLKVFSSFKMINYKEVSDGEELVDEWFLGESEESDNIEKVFEKYIQEVRNVLPSNSKSINKRDMVWGSWNDGVWRDISEKMLVKEAKILKKYFPLVKWFQLDDGYATYNNKPHGLGVAYEKSIGIDKNKFPKGLKHFTDRIRKIGLRPSIWIGGVVPEKTILYKEKKDWFLNQKLEGIDSYVFDVSKKDVREYMVNALDELVVKNGFDSIKHDFWSYPFEEDDEYSNKTNSGYYYRNWWLNEVKKRIAPDGYLQSGCAIAMGNIFLSKYFTNFRYGIDIGEGNWDNIKTIFNWATACLSLHIGDLMVVNSDSIGIFPNLPDNIFMFWTNFLIISRTCVELAGRYSLVKNRKNDRFRIIQKAVCNPNNGQNVHFVDFDYRKENAISPNIMYIKTSHFISENEKDFIPVRTVAIFNMEKNSNNYILNSDKLNLDDCEYYVYDVWTGNRSEFTNNELKIFVEKEDSKLLTICKKVDVCVLDANIRLVNACLENNILSFDTEYKQENAEFVFNRKPIEMLLNGKKIDFKYDAGKVYCRLKQVGKISFLF